VTYTVYAISEFWGTVHATPVAGGGTVTVTKGAVPNSNAVTLAPGNYV
jgi:hypothetical protein